MLSDRASNAAFAGALCRSGLTAGTAFSMRVLSITRAVTRSACQHTPGEGLEIEEWNY